MSRENLFLEEDESSSDELISPLSLYKEESTYHRARSNKRTDRERDIKKSPLKMKRSPSETKREEKKEKKREEKKEKKERKSIKKSPQRHNTNFVSPSLLLIESSDSEAYSDSEEDSDFPDDDKRILRDHGAELKEVLARRKRVLTRLGKEEKSVKEDE